ncbi:MAG: NAD(P)-dependent oxidoreductase [Candidatus Saccharimonadales bacterium]
MQVTVFGASGKVGMLVVEELLARGYDVVAFVHRHNPFHEKPRLKIVEGDVAKLADVERALQGSEAVFNCLGSWGRPGRNVLTVGMGTIIPAMEAQGIKRIISLTGHGADAPDVVPSLAHKLMMKLLSPFPAGTVFRDGEVHMHMLAASSLDWTALRSPLMKSKGKSTYTLTERPGFPLKVIARPAVASAMVDQLTLSEYIHRSPVVNLGK